MTEKTKAKIKALNEGAILCDQKYYLFADWAGYEMIIIELENKNGTWGLSDPPQEEMVLYCLYCGEQLQEGHKGKYCCKGHKNEDLN